MFFYQNDLTIDEFQLSEEESRHITKVLRKQVGDTIQCIDGKGNIASASIVQILKHTCIVQVRSKQFHPKTSSIRFVLAFAPVKNDARNEWVLEKATELGVDEIVCIKTDRTEKWNIKSERYHKIIVSALKQSKQFWLPELSFSSDLNSFIKNASLNNRSLICFGDCSKPQLSLMQFFQGNDLHKFKQIVICIGPEGDFSENEYALMKQFSIQGVHLGQSILRTETAAVFATSIARCFLDK